MSWFWLGGRMQHYKLRRTLIGSLAGSLFVLSALVAPLASSANGVTASHDPAKASKANTMRVPWSPNQHLHKLNPFYSAAYCYAADISIQQMMYRPGYYFGLGSSIALQPQLSAYNAPVFSSDSSNNTIVTFKVKPWMWSNGNTHATDLNGKATSAKATMQKTTAADAIYWLNMDKAMSQGTFYTPDGTLKSAGAYAVCGYVPKIGLPDAVLNVTAPKGLSGDTVQITFKGPQNHDWLIYNELSQMQPMPKAWDTTAAAAAKTFTKPYTGSASTCSSESWSAIKTDGSDLCSFEYGYQRNLLLNDPYWHWANGPYRVSTIGYANGVISGNDVQIANLNYSGPVKAHAIQKLVYVPETDTPTETNQCAAGQLDSCYVDPSLITASPGIGKVGTLLDPKIKKHFVPIAATSWAISYLMFNSGNANSVSPCLVDGKQSNTCAWAGLDNQQYFRQAMYRALDQKYLISHVLNGYAVPTTSAIPPVGGKAFQGKVKDAIPFNLKAAIKLMTDHGWSTPDGVNASTCQLDNCGTSDWPIAKGAAASVTLLYPSGDPTTDYQINDEVAMWIRAGIKVTAQAEPVTTVGDDCFGATDHTWSLCSYGGWTYAPDFYPSGETLFGTGAGSNSWGYSSPIMDALIAATTQNGSYKLSQTLSAADAAKYGSSAAAGQSFVSWSNIDLPVLWMPTPTGFSLRLKTVKGAQAPNPLGNRNPEYITKLR